MNSRTMNNGWVKAEWDLDADGGKAEFSFSPLPLLELLESLQLTGIIWKQNPLLLANFLFWCNFNPVDKLQEWSRNPHLLFPQTHPSVYLWPTQCISQTRIHNCHLHTQWPLSRTFPRFSPLRPLLPCGIAWPAACGPQPPWSPPTSLTFLSHAPSQALLPASLKRSVLNVHLGPLAGCVSFLWASSHICTAKTVICMLTEPNHDSSYHLSL